jgi:O-methyltransferase involved in polyketide biosynthesis
MDLSQISRTAILTLISRAVASEVKSAGLPDPMAVLSLDRLISAATGEDRRWIEREKRTFAGHQRLHAVAGARRAKVFDAAAARFIAENPACTVISLGCGFDTRYWRIAHEHYRYIDLDLPEVIALKKEILKNHLGYEMIGRSVLDAAWIDEVTAGGNSHFLLVAEGLFDWLPKQEAIRLLALLGQRFERSQIVLDWVPESWTRGPMKWAMRLESRINWGLAVSWASGIKHPREIESFGPGLKVLGFEKGSAGPVITVALGGAQPPAG